MSRLEDLIERTKVWGEEYLKEYWLQLGEDIVIFMNESTEEEIREFQERAQWDKVGIICDGIRRGDWV